MKTETDSINYMLREVGVRRKEKMLSSALSSLKEHVEWKSDPWTNIHQVTSLKTFRKRLHEYIA